MEIKPITRRDSLKSLLLASVVSVLPVGPVLASHPAPYVGPREAKWIDKAAPEYDLGQMFGLAWPRGTTTAGQSFAAKTADGIDMPVQSWVAASWPDGSVKWTTHALPAGYSSAGVKISPGSPVMADEPVSAIERKGCVEIRQGDIVWRVPKAGAHLIEGAKRGDQTLVGPVSLAAAFSEDPRGVQQSKLSPFIESVELERTGPIQAVVRVQGRHSAVAPELPFDVRLYFTQNSQAVRIVHNFIYDGDPKTDFLSAVGLQVEVPLRAANYDRHIRIGLDQSGMFAEAAVPLTGLRRDPGQAYREAQAAGKAVPPLAEMSPLVRDRLEYIPVWNDFRLQQHSANGAVLQKRTSEGHAWIDCDETGRAPGFASVSDPFGGAALSTRYFWQRHPSAVHVEGLSRESATMSAWLWSPDADPMDLRSYRGVMGMEEYDAQNEGLQITYEDYEPGWDDARGIARTSELTLWALDATPQTDALRQMADAGAEPPRLLADPAQLHEAGVFGVWSLPDRSQKQLAIIEDQLENLTDFYAGEIDRRSWYGFWDHGDVMHTYDFDRHQWRYDIGGYAWDNSELSTDLWLWYQAVRTGDARTFRMAEAMTRHTGEVDIYHLGRFAGLGTRHGVQHFSDSSKQPRISTSVYRRMFFYLTGDDRTGDQMRSLLGSSRRLAEIVIRRKVPRHRLPVLEDGEVEMGFGTMWCSLAANWLTEWERTGDTKWRDMLIAGMETIGAMPQGWMTGSAGFDLETGRFRAQDQVNILHLNAVFGAFEINAELLQLFDLPTYRRAWLDYCIYYNAPRQQFEARFGRWKGPFNLGEAHSRLTGYAATQLDQPAMARRAAQEFYDGRAGLGTKDYDPRKALPDGNIEWPDVSTNTAAQWSVAAIQNLALIPDALVSESPFND